LNFTTPTAVVNSISPAQGQGGTTITIAGEGFGSNMDLLHVYMGCMECEILTSSDTSIECIAPRHAAGTYEMVVVVSTAGIAESNGACFTYLLTLTSITPTAGAASGGYLVSIMGEGFLDHFTAGLRAFDTSAPSPWLRHGLGLLKAEDIRCLNLCPGSVRDRFKYGLRFIQSCLADGETTMGNTTKLDHDACPPSQLPHVLPAQVRIGDSPCIITEATIDHLLCTTSVSPTGSKSVTVSLFDQEATLMDAFFVDPELTPIVTSVSPRDGLVTGGTVLTLTGRHLATSSDPNVTIGNVDCPVLSADDTIIVCVTPPHGPGTSLIFVFTTSGAVAGLESLLENFHDGHFYPVFEYTLFTRLQDGVIPFGSLVGGTPFVLQGGKYEQEETVVYVGEETAEIISFQEDELVVLSPTSTAIRDVHLNVIELTTG
jgi:hypothetical protein